MIYKVVNGKVGITMIILGVHVGHDSTAVLMQDGKIIEAMSEERLSRAKKHVGFPSLSVEYIKEKYNIDHFPEVVIVGQFQSDGVFVTTEENINNRKGGTVLRKYFLRSIGFKFPIVGQLIRLRDWIMDFVNGFGASDRAKKFIAKQFPGANITYIDHHAAHAWTTVPFLSDLKKEHVVLTLDGVGDYLAASVNKYKDGKIEVVTQSSYKSSLGLLYCAVVDILGMSRNEHEFKVMGLAPYAKASSGEKVYQKLKKLVWFNEEKLVFESRINLFWATGYLIANEFYKYRFDSLAYGMQKLTEELIKDMARSSINKLGTVDVAVSGGVFMNVKANQYLREMPEVKSLTIVPSCGDESLAIGAVVARYSELNNGDLTELKPIANLYLGSEYTDEDIKSAIDSYEFNTPVDIHYFDSKDATSIEHKVAELLASNSVVGRFKGRAEWGARALGNRSILANPSSRDNVKLINEMIKGRDFWMPFATSLLYEKRHDYLDELAEYKAPYMAITFNTKPKAHGELIAALHPYDLTSRPQMVEKTVNAEYHNLISHFESLTGIGGILNTSFNLHGEPNVEKPFDALRTFALSGMPHLAIGNYLISKRS